MTTTLELKALADLRREDPQRLLPPAFHNSPPAAATFGPEVGAFCTQVGMTPDPEQQLVLDDLFAVGPDGLPACFEYGLVGPRQNLKTGVLKMYALGCLYVLDVGPVSWSAHLLDTARATFQDLVNMIEGHPVLRKRLAPGRTNGIFRGRNDMRIELRGDLSLAFSARTDDGGRGLTGKRVVLDEALALTPSMLGALLPTLLAMEDAQAVYASTAGKIGSAALRAKRDAGRAGLDPSMGWAEWAARRKECRDEECRHFPPGHPGYVQGCALDDESLWWEAMPLLGRRRANGTGLTVKRVAELRKSLPPAEFQRELVGWWDDPGTGGVFGDSWSQALASWQDDSGNTWPGYPSPPDFQLESMAVAVAADLSEAAVVGAGHRNGKKAVRVIATGANYEWVVGKVQELREKFPGAPVALDPGGPAGVLKPRLEKVVKPSRRLVSATFEQWKVACADFWDGIQRGTLEHGGQPELDDAADKAEQRKVLDRWVWERYGYNAAPLEAATLAAWALDNGRRTSAYEGGRGVLTV